MLNKFNMDGVFQEEHFQKVNDINDITNDNDKNICNLLTAVSYKIVLTPQNSNLWPNAHKASRSRH